MLVRTMAWSYQLKARVINTYAPGNIITPSRSQMPSSPSLRVFLFAVAMLCPALSLSAAIVEIRTYHGKQIRCYHSGVIGVGKRCGTYGYTRVFTGTVLSAVEISDTDKRLLLHPDEVFLGDNSEVNVTTNQACLSSEINVGDKWLFFLRWDGEGIELRLGYGSPSKPIAKAQDDIGLLRRLQQLTDSGVVSGRVTRTVRQSEPKSWRIVPVPDQKVVARRASDGTEYYAMTSNDGHFQLELPDGSYDLTGGTEPDLWAPQRQWTVESGSCFDANFLFHADGKISGRVTDANGAPVKHAQVDIVPTSPKNALTVATDEKGHFEVDAHAAVPYLVGIGILAQPESREWESRIYYPGVTAKNKAEMIFLEDGEWRTDIDLILPNRTAR